MCCIGNSFSLWDQRHCILVAILAYQEGVKCNKAIYDTWFYWPLDILCLTRKAHAGFPKDGKRCPVVVSLSDYGNHSYNQVRLCGAMSWHVINLTSWHVINLTSCRVINLASWHVINLPSWHVINLTLWHVTNLTSWRKSHGSCSYFSWCDINFGLWENLCLTLWMTVSHLMI